MFSASLRRPTFDWRLWTRDGKRFQWRTLKNHFELLKSSIFTSFHKFSLLFSCFCCCFNFHEQFSSEILQTFNLFTSLWSSFFPMKIFFSHKNFLLHSNFDWKVARKHFFLSVKLSKLASSDSLVWKMYNFVAFYSFSSIKSFLTKIVHFFTTPAHCRFSSEEWKNFPMTSFSSSSGFTDTTLPHFPELHTCATLASWEMKKRQKLLIVSVKLYFLCFDLRCAAGDDQKWLILLIKFWFKRKKIDRLMTVFQ